MRKLRDWWRLDGKVLTYKIILLLLVLGPILKNIPAIRRWLPDDRYAFLFLAAALLLLLQIVMALLGERSDEVRIIDFNPASPEFIRSLKRAKRLDVAFSSTETLFPYIQDALVSLRIECRVLLRNPETGNTRMKAKLVDYEARWKELPNTDDARCKVDVRYWNNTVLRLLILDDAEAYVGFYKVTNGRLRGHNVPMLHVEAGTPLSDYLLAVVKNRFEAGWDAGSEVVGERPVLI